MVNIFKEYKNFWQSKTFWLSVLQFGIGVASAIEGQLNMGIALTVSGVLTIIMRTLTSSKMNWKIK